MTHPGYLWHSFINPINMFGGIGTIAILSLVFKENRLYRLFEHIFLGLALGYDLFFTWTTVLRPLWWDPMVKQGQWPWIVAIPIGLMFYTIYIPRFAWMSRVIFGFFFALIATLNFQQFCSRFIPQVADSNKPLLPPHITGPHATLHEISYVVNNTLFMVILICVIVYFFFAFEQKSRLIQAASKTGRWFLMFAFGAIFGATIMTRMALLIDRMYFIFHDWLHWTS